MHLIWCLKHSGTSEMWRIVAEPLGSPPTSSSSKLLMENTCNSAEPQEYAKFSKRPEQKQGDLIFQESLLS